MAQIVCGPPVTDVVPPAGFDVATVAVKVNGEVLVKGPSHHEKPPPDPPKPHIAKPGAPAPIAPYAKYLAVFGMVTVDDDPKNQTPEEFLDVSVV